MTEEVQTLVERERDAAIATANANALKILELIAQAKAMNSQIEELREALERIECDEYLSPPQCRAIARKALSSHNREGSND